MPNVTVEPDKIVLTVAPGETVIEAAWRLGYVWPTTCYGRAECTACHVDIIDGAEHASPVEDEEAAALAVLGARRQTVRLACRLQFDGDAVVEKRGVRARP
jgi:2Fe-2S ferredoxin